MHLICSSCVELLPSLPSWGPWHPGQRVLEQNKGQEASHCTDWVPKHCLESISSFGYEVLATLTEHHQDSPFLVWVCAFSSKI